MDIAAWLHGLGLQRYEPVFCDNDIDGVVLPSLTAEGLKDRYYLGRPPPPAA